MTDTSKDPKDQEGQVTEVRKLPSKLEFVVKLTYWPRESPGSRRGHLSAPRRVTRYHHGPGSRRMVVEDAGTKGLSLAHKCMGRVSALTQGRATQMRARYTQRCRKGQLTLIHPGRGGGSKDREIGQA